MARSKASRAIQEEISKSFLAVNDQKSFNTFIANILKLKENQINWMAIHSILMELSRRKDLKLVVPSREWLQAKTNELSLSGKMASALYSYTCSMNTSQSHRFVLPNLCFVDLPYFALTFGIATIATVFLSAPTLIPALAISLGLTLINRMWLSANVYFEMNHMLANRLRIERVNRLDSLERTPHNLIRIMHSHESFYNVAYRVAGRGYYRQICLTEEDFQDHSNIKDKLIDITGYRKELYRGYSAAAAPAWALDALIPLVVFGGIFAVSLGICFLLPFPSLILVFAAGLPAISGLMLMPAISIFGAAGAAEELSKKSGVYDPIRGPHQTITFDNTLWKKDTPAQTDLSRVHTRPNLAG